MATFVVLPPRELLEHSINDFIRSHFPGFTIPHNTWETVLEGVISAQGEDVFALHREDLAETTDVTDSLTTGFGAEPGDQVLEVGMPRGKEAAGVKTWPIRVASVSVNRVVC